MRYSSFDMLPIAVKQKNGAVKSFSEKAYITVRFTS